MDELLKGLFDPNQWAQAGLGPMDRAIEHLIEGPSYATLWTLDRKVLKAQALRAQWARDLAAWQLLMQGAWTEATKRFLREVNAADGAPIKSWRELTDLWVDIANATLTETHRTPEFLETQRRLTRSSTDCRLQEREIAEAYCEIHHIPTRTEVDELQRSVYELRRDLRSLQRALRTSGASPPIKAPAQPKRARKSRSNAAAVAPRAKD
jgi:polyhydroxyalkanoate synthesis regulator phasin